MQITRDLWIDESEIHEEFIRAAGPGGQNVNKVATAVQLRFDIRRANLPAEIRARLVRLAGRRVSGAGVLIIEARRFRAQAQNRADARARLAALIRQAATPLPPRRKTKPTRGSRERRLQAKKRRGELKRARGALD